MFSIDFTKRYGIMLSGGLDSAILLALIVKDNPAINIQPFTVPKYDTSYQFVNPILDYINQRYSTNIPSTRIVGNPDLHHSEQNASGVKEILYNNYVDYLFIGLNQNPPELSTLTGAPKRLLKSDNIKIILPFIDYYKDKILELMYNNDLADLIDITQSCTEMSTRPTRCGVCWQCTERAWAFKQLNKIDTGKY